MRLIDADALRARFQAILDRGDMFCEYDIIGMVDNAPTVFDEKAYSDGYTQGTCDCEHAHERPQGEWIMEENNKDYPDGRATCSCCGYKMDVKRWEWLPAVRWYLKPNYCPECGAEMR